MEFKQYHAFGMLFDFVGMQDVVKAIRESVDSEYSYIVTPNVNHVVRYQSDEGLRRAYAKARYRLCDSRILGFLFNLKRQGPTIVPGSDLTVVILDEANDHRWSISVIGSSSDDIAALTRMYPNVRFAHYNPPMGFYDNEFEVEKCVRFISENGANIYLFAVGSPRQECLAERVLSIAGMKGVGLCIGASVMFVTGSLKRAPYWIQKLGFEWLYRIASEPRRLFGRYISDGIRFIPRLLCELFRR